MKQAAVSSTDQGGGKPNSRLLYKDKAIPLSADDVAQILIMMQCP